VRTKEEPVYVRALYWLEHADWLVYSLIAMLFLAAAVAMTIYSVATFVAGQQDFPFRLVIFVNDLLLVLIIMEVLGTVRTYLAKGHTSLHPFLYIGIISATRRILAIGAEATLGSPVGADFGREMVELGVNAGVVLALAIALFLFRLYSGQPARDEA
jgi:uncharacterized membrane protein (DUF373 family)